MIFSLVIYVYMSYFIDFSTGCSVFNLSRYSDYEVAEIADITFHTHDTSVCLLACFDIDSCKVAVFDKAEDTCQLFTTRGVTDLTRNQNDNSDIYYRTCQGAICFQKTPLNWYYILSI